MIESNIRRCRAHAACAIGAVVMTGSIVRGGSPPPDYDFDWVTIGDPGNAVFAGGEFGDLAGRGSVNYEYRVSRLEITSAQWMEFVNTFAGDLGDPFDFGLATFSGFEQDLSYSGPGRQYKLRHDVDSPGMLPVFGISWRNAARYANWLHNDKAPTLEALATGAYDTSTFGRDPKTNFLTDAATHLPGAKFWLPTLDEWIKAAHYDPDKLGEGEGGWWRYPDGSDTALAPGAPGIGETSSQFIDADLVAGPHGEYDIPLGAYADVLSPWGLLDVSGGAQEWTEELFFPEAPSQRGFDGSMAGAGFGEFIDRLENEGSGFPENRSMRSFRLASSVPTPGAALAFGAFTALALTKRRKRQQLN